MLESGSPTSSELRHSRKQVHFCPETHDEDHDESLEEQKVVLIEFYQNRSHFPSGHMNDKEGLAALGIRKLYRGKVGALACSWKQK